MIMAGYGNSGGGGYGQRQGGGGYGGGNGGGGGRSYGGGGNGGGQQRPAKEWPIPSTFDEAKNYRLNFGKFKGNTLNVLAKSKDGLTYIHWLSENVDGDKYKDTAAAIDLFTADPRVQADIGRALADKEQDEEGAY
jgi:hypothetical protein